jgi:NAD-dependent DNA ligase
VTYRCSGSGAKKAAAIHTDLDRRLRSLAGEGGGSKRDKAEKLGVPILDEPSLQALIES